MVVFSLHKSIIIIFLSATYLQLSNATAKSESNYEIINIIKLISSQISCNIAFGLKYS